MSGYSKAIFIFSAVIIFSIGIMFFWQWIDDEREVVNDPIDRMFKKNNKWHYYPPLAAPDEE